MRTLLCSLVVALLSVGEPTPRHTPGSPTQRKTKECLLTEDGFLLCSHPDPQVSTGPRVPADLQENLEEDLLSQDFQQAEMKTSESITRSSRRTALLNSELEGSGSETGSGMGSETGSGMGSETGSGMGSETGSGMGSETGSGMGSETGSGIGSETVSGMGSEIESEGRSGTLRKYDTATNEPLQGDKAGSADELDELQHKGHQTPGWIIILAFVVAVAALVMLCVAIATREKWNGPRPASQQNTKSGAPVQQRTVETQTLLDRKSPEEEGGAEEYTVIPLDELPEKCSGL